MHWKKPPITEKAAILSEIRKIETGYGFTPENCIIETMTLPFFKDAVLVQLYPQVGMPLWYVRLPAEIVPLDGSMANLNYIEAIDPPLSKTDAGYHAFRMTFGKKPLPAKFGLQSISL